MIGDCDPHEYEYYSWGVIMEQPQTCTSSPRAAPDARPPASTTTVGSGSGRSARRWSIARAFPPPAVGSSQGAVLNLPQICGTLSKALRQRPRSTTGRCSSQGAYQHLLDLVAPDRSAPARPTQPPRQSSTSSLRTARPHHQPLEQPRGCGSGPPKSR